MSELCVVNLKETEMDFGQLNELANKLVNIALEEKIAVVFNSCGMFEEKKPSGVKNYFTVSETFLSFDSNDFGLLSLFDLQSLVLKLCNGDEYEPVEKDGAFKTEFVKRFGFFDKIISCIFDFPVSEIEIYFIENICDIIDFDEIETVNTSAAAFLDDLFGCVEDIIDNKFNYVIPRVKFIIRRESGRTVE